MAKASAKSRRDTAVADQLRKLGLKKGILIRIAESGQLIELKCEMPQCYNPNGRTAFDEVTTPRTSWAPSPDHYPVLKSEKGKLSPDNVRLAHVRCNHLDYVRRNQIRQLLARGESLVAIAEKLNKRGIQPFHGTNAWTPELVRKAYIS